MSEGKHPHAPKKIVRETQLYNGEWLRLREKVRESVSKAQERFEEQGPLIRYLEKALIKLPKLNEGQEVKALW